jgi:hypothetical protein
VLTDAVDDVSGSIDIANDTGERFPDLAQVGGPQVQKILRRPGVVARAGHRLRDFVRQRGCQFPHHAHAVHMGEIRLELTQCFFGPFSLGQIEHERNGLAAAFSEQSAAKKDGNAGAVFAKILLFEGLNGPS